MIYDSLEIIPYKLFMRIVENTNLVNLLSTNKDEDIEVLKPVWNSLFDEYKEISPEREEIKLLHLKKEIEFLSLIHI